MNRQSLNPRLPLPHRRHPRRMQQSLLKRQSLLTRPPLRLLRAAR